MTDIEAEKMLEFEAAKLAEHFGAVQILVSWVVEGKTHLTRRGQGNFYARIGMCHDMIASDIAQENAAALAPKINPPDDTENWKKP